MTNFDYQTPTRLIFGKDVVNGLADVLRPLGTRVLLTYGGGSIKRMGLYDKVKELLKMLRMLLTRCRTEKIISVYGTDRSLDDDVTAVKHYIEANYRQKIMSTDLEKLIHFKPTYVMTHFKKQTGMTIMSYAIKERTKHALDDYLTHDIPIGEAAKKNGFCHYNHFTKACRKYYGASPTEIKKQKRGKQVSLPLDIPA